ncbi:MAG: hypothetical protein AAFX10_02160 [Pseudomonadota bacterium]
MDLRTKHPFQNPFATTVFFAVGAPLVTLVLIVASTLAGDGFAAAEHPADWFTTCISVAAYALFAGILVDATRLLTTFVWRKKLPFRLKFKKLLKDNLAASDPRTTA